MKKIDKTESPAFFSDYIKRNKPKHWNDISFIRDDLRKHIYNEQGGCCAYTEIHLKDHSNNHCHIDHFKTRNLHPELAFDYKNLIVACNSDDYGAKHKDKQVKKKEDYTQLINPVEENPTDHIEYTFTGRITAHQDSPKGKQTIQYFNLNNKRLIERRKECLRAIDSMEEFSEDELVKLIGEFETMIRQLYNSM